MFASLSSRRGHAISSIFVVLSHTEQAGTAAEQADGLLIGGLLTEVAIANLVARTE